VAAPPAQVWAALRAHPELVFHGLPADAWPAQLDCQEPLFLRVAWPFTPEPTEVSFVLRDLAGSTRLDLRHQGWAEGPRWDEPVQGHFSGWLEGLALLGLMIETGRDGRTPDAALAGRERYFISGEVPAAVAPVYRSLTDEATLERWAEGILDGATRVEELEHKLLRWRLPSGGELVAIFRPTPRGTHVALAEYGGRGREASARWPAMFERLTRFLG
jgi:hypothetical protein